MAQRRLNSDYADRDKWLKMAVINTAMSGIFSSDRTIREYNDNIWHLQPLNPSLSKPPVSEEKTKETNRPIRVKAKK